MNLWPYPEQCEWPNGKWSQSIQSFIEDNQHLELHQDTECSSDATYSCTPQLLNSWTAVFFIVWCFQMILGESQSTAYYTIIIQLAGHKPSGNCGDVCLRGRKYCYRIDIFEEKLVRKKNAGISKFSHSKLLFTKNRCIEWVWNLHVCTCACMHTHPAKARISSSLKFRALTWGVVDQMFCKALVWFTVLPACYPTADETGEMSNCYSQLPSFPQKKERNRATILFCKGTDSNFVHCICLMFTFYF